jgi:hypothetical protein
MIQAQALFNSIPEPIDGESDQNKDHEKGKEKDEGAAHYVVSNSKKEHLKLQYDYLAAYLDFFSEDPKLAATIAERYVNYPIPSWRKRYNQIILLLNRTDCYHFKVPRGEKPTC